jgi:hypothetical protein
MIVGSRADDRRTKCSEDDASELLKEERAQTLGLRPGPVPVAMSLRGIRGVGRIANRASVRALEAHRMLTHPRRLHGSVVIVLLALACGTSTPTQPYEPPQLPGSCGIMASPSACTAQTMGCPRVPPAGARTVIIVSTCEFGMGEGGCLPVALPECRSPAATTFQFHVAREGDTCVADVTLELQPRTGGGADVRWTSQEFGATASATCAPIGVQSNGTLPVSSACCDASLDLPMNDSSAVFRVVIHTDWIASGG